MSDLFADGVALMVFGMGTVFVFLTVLVIVTTLMSKVLQRWFPEAEPVAPVSRQAPANADPHLRKVLAAAVAEYKNRRK